MTVLLTGGTGYIGSHAAAALAAAGHAVVLLDDLSNSRIDVVDRLSRIAGSTPAFVQGDVRDEALLRRVLSEHRVEAVLHFAGLKSVEESRRDPLRYYAANVQGAIALLQAMQATGVRRLIFSSSATVYGAPDYLPLDEDHPLRAGTPYGRTKLQVEQMLRDHAGAHPDWRIATLRYFNPVGAHASGLIGEEPNGAPANLMPWLAQAASGRLGELHVHGVDYPTADGSGVRDYLHVEDLAEGHVAALAYLETSTGFDAFNLGTGTGVSVLEMIAAFERANGVRVPHRAGPRREGDVASCFAQAAKARRVMGWSARRGLDDMCRSAWRWELSQSGSGPHGQQR